MWRFFKDFMIYGFASVLGKLAAIFLMPIYTNILTKEEYGAMALITSCKGIIDLVSNLNIHSGIARDYYEVGDNRKKLVSTGFWSITSIACFVCVALVFSRHFWSSQVLGLEDIYIGAFTIMLLTIPCGSLMSYFAILTRYKKKPVLYTVGNITQLLMQIGLSVFCVAYLRTGVVGIFIGLLVSEIFATLYYALINRSYIGFQFDKSYLRRALLFCLPTLPAILAGWIDSSLGQIVIGKYISKADLGVYSIALSLASAFTLVSTALHNVWSPFLYENYSKPNFKRDIHRLFTAVVLALLFISISLSLFSNEVILLLSNPGYLDAAKYVTVLCLPMSIYLLFPFATSGISISRDTKYIGISYIAGSVMNIVSMVILVPIIGIIAVPLCLAMSRITTYTALYKISEKKIQYNLPNYLLIVLACIVLACYFIVYFDTDFCYRLVLAILAYSILYIYISKKIDIKSLLLSKIKK